MAKKLYPEEAVQDIADSIRRINGSSDNYKISQMSGAIDDFDEEFARVDGYYENLTAGNAEQLLATKFTEDKMPYLFRSTGGTADVGNREYDTIVGGSVVENQLVQTTDTSVTVQSGHKYYSNINGVKTIGQSDGTAIAINDGTKDNVRDLTLKFGTDIADYAYQLEQTTAGSGIAWLKSQGFLTEDYIPYNEGEIKSVSGLVSHDMVGFNQWDEEWRKGYYNATTGAFLSNINYIANKNPIRVIPNTRYYMNSPSNIVVGVFFYDENGNFVTRMGLTTWAPGTFNIPEGCHYINFYTDTPYGTTYNNDICINLSWSGYRNGEYEPYQKHSYPLDSSLTLMGVLNLVDGKIQYDGDLYHSDGKHDERYTIVDLGTLDWYYNATYSFFYTTELSKANGIYNFVCEKYAQGNVWSSSTDKISMGNSSNGTFYIKDTAYTDATAFKAAMSGVMLVCEKATPTTSQAEPFTNPQICDDFGTEEYVTNGIPVGHETRYPANLRDKLQHLPNLASADGDYIIRQSNNDMVLVPIPTTAEELPDAPTTDGNYVLKCSVADGEVTYTWESEE